MDFNLFRKKIVFRFIAIFLSFAGGFLLLIYSHFYYSSLLLFVLCIYQIYLLIRTLDAAHRRLAAFFHSIAHADFTRTFSKGNEDKHLRDLNDALNEVVEKFRDIRSRGEENEFVQKTILEHIGTGLIVVNDKSEITLLNPAARRMLQIKHLKNLHEFPENLETFAERIMSVQPDTHALLKIKFNHEITQIAMNVSHCRIRDSLVRIVAIQDIGRELERKELESWQLLTRVLAHEIMNSMTPIISLAHSAKDVMADNESMDEMQISEIKTAMDAIGRRSEGLSEFVNKYRNLAHVPRPEFKTIELKPWIENLVRLVQDDFTKAGIKLTVLVKPENLELIADPGLLEQMIINLLLNSRYAVLENTNEPKVNIEVHEDISNRIVISVTDNGKGIQPELIEDIFIPFFTTRKGGSGIGLSLCRQIMHLHQGSISASSVPQQETRFTMIF
ncbi:MAG: PAS domain-containing protein [Bacteroidetes bacterium]|nr:PAS domain-containing protein [Bacteroidota bacterium]